MKKAWPKVKFMRYANLRYRKNAPVHRENGAPEYYDTLDSLNAPTRVDPVCGSKVKNRD